MKLYFSYGWTKPYCFTVNDSYISSDEESIVDGGFYHYNIPNHEKHLQRLAEGKFKFIMGFDRCPKEKATQYLKWLQKEGQTVCPIVHNIEAYNEIPVDTDFIATDSLEVVKANKGYQLHWLGNLPDEHLDKINTADINPYENKVPFLIRNMRLAKYQPAPIPEELLKHGEFILYGSALFLEKPNDYDLLYFGDKDPKEIHEMLPSEYQWSVCKAKEEDIHNGGITHILFAVDNGLPFTPTPNIQELYEKAKANIQNIQEKVIKHKNFIAYRYMRNLQYIKEFKTLLIANHYLHETPLSKLLYDRLHLTYRVLQTDDSKAHMLLNRELHQKFNLSLYPHYEPKYNIYKNNEIEKAYHSFFTRENNIYIDEEQIQITL